MTIDQSAIGLILLVMLALFVWGRVRYDIVAVGGLVVAVTLGLVPAQFAFYGFGHPAVITVAAVLVMSRALQQSGAVGFITQQIRNFSDTPARQIGSLSGVAAGLSGFMNNVGALALLMPVAMDSCRRAERSPKLILMPLAFASILGGMVTLIGTPPNILIATIRAESLGEGFAMFDFAYVGLPVAVLGVLFVTFVGWRLIPFHGDEKSSTTDAFQIDAYLSELAVPKASVAHGKTLSEIETLTEEIDVAIVGLVRRKRHYPRPPQHEPLTGHDRLIVEGAAEELDAFVQKLGLRVAGSKPEKAMLVKAEQAVFSEAVVQPESGVIGRTVGSLRLKGRYNVTLLGVSRQGKTSRGRLNDYRLRAGDVILVEGLENDVPDALQRLGCLPLAERSVSVGTQKRALWAVGLFGLAIAVAATGYLPIAVSFAGAIIGVVLVGILPVREIYSAIDWPVIVLLGALIPIGGAMETTGVTVLVAEGIANLGGTIGPTALVTLLLVVTMTLSDMLNNAATTVVMAPIAISVAQALGLSPDPFLMAVAIGASCAFLTPIGHQNNALVMGPGGYRFGDYWRLGLPLEFLIVVVSVPLILFFWPF